MVVVCAITVSQAQSDNLAVYLGIVFKWLLKWLSRVWASASAAGGRKFVGQPGVADFASARNLVGFEPGAHKRWSFGYYLGVGHEEARLRFLA